MKSGGIECVCVCGDGFFLKHLAGGKLSLAHFAPTLFANLSHTETDTHTYMHHIFLPARSQGKALGRASTVALIRTSALPSLIRC